MKILDNSREFTSALENIGRAVYYAKSFNPNKDIEAQLDYILLVLGVYSPKQVGLNNNILDKRIKEEKK